jgi:predicted RNA-binding Zn-ribbon protein involved in translation (DUF1610 family)
MPLDSIKPRWAPRVPPRLIERLYESDARGLLDEELVDDVGMRLYLRIQSILAVRRIQHDGLVPCPACGATIEKDGGTTDPDYTLHCGTCGWEMLWRKYWSTFRHQELAGDFGGFISDFLREWERARTPTLRMLAIDRLIHRWHNDTQQKRPGYGTGRPAAVNLIEGSRRQVIQFLDRLTFGGDAVTRERWRENLSRVRETVRRSRSRDRSDATR